MSYQGEREPRVLKHRLSSRLFHWGLVLGFIPAAITGFIIWLKPGSEEFVNMAMKVHIIGAAILTVAVISYSSVSINRIVAFIRQISEWGYNDFKWMMVGGGYAHKMILKKEISVPPMGKLNSGQKSMGILMFHGGIFLLFSGWILYSFIPLAPKELIYWLDFGHLWIGVFLGLCTLAHIFLGIYNWEDFKAMFGDGTIPLSVAQHHNPLWVERDIESVQKDHKSDSEVIPV
ncbi:MAG: formate-DH-gamm: formate dehydrogenase, gamma subunit [Firmicutes bacterium]|nr:formate-DH-gamm: formate dehydrogenase, gamma subunit [Bacillota bacterium]